MSDDDARKDIERGFMFSHNMTSELFERLNRLSAHVYGLTEVLARGGVVEPAELEAARAATYEQMLQRMPTRWIGARLHADTADKYDLAQAVPIDCEKRLHLCKAACCKLGFFLSEQDLQEGTVRWDLPRPYHIAQRTDGYCIHCNPESRACEVWAARPLPCRRYDCRADRRIWADFDGYVPNPGL